MTAAKDASHRVTCSIEEHAFAIAVAYSPGAWLRLAREGRLKETLLDEGVRKRWAARPRRAVRQAARRPPPAPQLPKFRPTADDGSASRMVELAFRAPRWKVFA
jgi:hypothetical protein